MNKEETYQRFSSGYIKDMNMERFIPLKKRDRIKEETKRRRRYFIKNPYHKTQQNENQRHIRQTKETLRS